MAVYSPSARVWNSHPSRIAIHEPLASVWRIGNEKRFDSIGSAPGEIVRMGLRGDSGALSIGAFGRSRWRLRRARSTYAF
jgi:hypothetical protein